MVSVSSFLTLTAYLAVFLFSLILSRIYENSLNAQQLNGVIQRWLARSLVILPVALLIGLRAMSVGYDTQQMTTLLFSHRYPLDEVLETQHDPLSIVVSYALNPICFGNRSAYLFLVSYGTLYCFMLGIEQWRRSLSLSFALTVYYLYFALLGMDQFKQLFALSIAFIGIGKLRNGSVKQFVALTVIAGLFHSTAFLAFLMLLFRIKEKKYRIVAFVLIILLVFAGLNVSMLFSIASSIFGEGAYSSYFNGDLYYRSTSDEGSGLGFILHLAPCMFPLLFYQTIPVSDRWYVLLPLVATFPFRMLGYESEFLLRLYYTPAIMLTVAIPLISQNIRSRKRQLVFNALSISMLVMYYYIAFSTGHGVVPYSFAI